MRILTRKIVQEGWEFTQQNKKLIFWYAFFPSLLTILVGMIYLVYQYYAFLSSALFEDWDRSFAFLAIAKVLQVLRDNFSTTLPILITALIIGLLYLLIPSFCEGAMIQMIARKKNGQKVQTRDGIRYGLMSFLKLFEFSWLVRSFSYVSFITWGAFVARNLGMSVFYSLLWLFIFLAIIGIFMSFLFIYTQFFIVIDSRKVMSSMAKSSGLVMTHLEETLMLGVLMIIISLRILVQLLFVLLIPALVGGAIYFIASSTVPFLALVAGGSVGAVLLYIASYLSATLHVFGLTVWTFTFLEITENDQLTARGEKVSWYKDAEKKDEEEKKEAEKNDDDKGPPRLLSSE